MTVLAIDMRAACPSCHPGDHPAVAPLGETVPDVNGSVRASYTCPVCGARWHCWWDRAGSGWPAPLDHPPAALPAAA